MKNFKKRGALSFQQKLMGTLCILLLYRLLSHIPLPFVDSEYVSSLIGQNGTLGFMNTLTGGNLASMSVVALGITPYITSSIVLQLLGTCFPSLSQMQKDGATGQAKFKKITIGLAVFLSLLQSVGMLSGYGKQGVLTVVTWYSILIPVLIVTCGVFLLSYLGQYITDHYFGNGISLLLVTGILCSYVTDAVTLYSRLCGFNNVYKNVISVIAGSILLFLLFGFIVWLNFCEKRIPISYSGKLVQNQALMQQHSVIPLKLMGSSVVPVIFASTLFGIPSLVSMFTGKTYAWMQIFDMSKWLNVEPWWANFGILIYLGLIIVFAYYYQFINMNEREIADNLKKQGGTIVGVRPGKPTEEYLHRQMKYLTLLGSLSLCIIAFIPIVGMRVLHVSNLGFLGTSLIIVVSVVDDTFTRYGIASKDMFYRKSHSFLRKTTKRKRAA